MTPRTMMMMMLRSNKTSVQRKRKKTIVHLASYARSKSPKGARTLRK